MTQSTSCAFCLENSHTIQFCRDPRIVESFKQLICSGVNCPDFVYTKTILDDYTDSLILAISVQMARTISEESRERHIEIIIETIRLETEYLSHLAGLQRDEYLRWLYPEDAVDNSVNHLDDNVLNMATIFERFAEEDGDYTLYRPDVILLSIEQKEGELAECSICLETTPVIDMDTFQCQHPFCHRCVLHMLVNYTKMCCPFCRAQVKTIEVKDIEHFNEIQQPPLYLYLA